MEPGKRSGKPCIRGLRITVQDVLEYLAGGMTEDDILQDFSKLTREDIKACLAIAADRERKLFVAPTSSCFSMRISRSASFRILQNCFRPRRTLRAQDSRKLMMIVFGVGRSSIDSPSSPRISTFTKD